MTRSIQSKEAKLLSELPNVTLFHGNPYDEADLQAPAAIHDRKRGDERPDEGQAAEDDTPEGVGAIEGVSTRRRCDGDDERVALRAGHIVGFGA